MTEQVNINIIEGEPFFAHETSINYNPTQLILDFKCITPRNDPRSKRANFQIKHNIVMIEPWHATALLSLLNNVIKRYEKDFGKIKKPKQLEKAEKIKKEKQNTEQTSDSAPTYMG
jgi:hypothetical protein